MKCGYENSNNRQDNRNQNDRGTKYPGAVDYFFYEVERVTAPNPPRPRALPPALSGFSSLPMAQIEPSRRHACRAAWQMPGPLAPALC